MVCLSVMVVGCASAPVGKPNSAPVISSPPIAAESAPSATEPARNAQPEVAASGSAKKSTARNTRPARSRVSDRSNARQKPVTTKVAAVSTQPAIVTAGVQSDMREFVGAVGVIVKTLESANVAFNTPKSMSAGRTEPVHLIFGVQSIADQLRAAGDAPGEEVAGPARLRHRIEARLYGADFEIAGIAPEEQPIGSSDLARWQWQVKPLRDGVHQLYLMVAVTADVRGQTIRRAETFQRQIVVEVVPWPDRMMGFASDHWQWLWASIAMPLIGWMWSKQKASARLARA
jgi:hypothetical protein